MDQKKRDKIKELSKTERKGLIDKLKKYDEYDPRGLQWKSEGLTEKMIGLLNEGVDWCRENKDVKEVAALLGAYVKLHEKILMHPHTLMEAIDGMDEKSKEVLLSMLEKNNLLVSFQESKIDKSKLFD